MDISKIDDVFSVSLEQAFNDLEIDKGTITPNQVMKHVNDFLSESGIVSFSSERLSDFKGCTEVKLNGEVELLDPDTWTRLKTTLEDLVPQAGIDGINDTNTRNEKIKELGENVIANLLISSNEAYHSVHELPNKDALARDQYFGSLLGDIGYDIINNAGNISISAEEFGTTMDNIKEDARISTAAIVLRKFTSLPDKLFSRISNPSGTIMINVEEISKYDLNRPSKSANVNQAEIQSLPDLYRDPSSISTRSRAVEFTADSNNNDDDLFSSTSLLATGRTINVFQKTYSTTTAGFNHYAETDQISEGAKIRSVILQVTRNPNTGSDVVETFKVDISHLSASEFTRVPNTATTNEVALGFMGEEFILNPAAMQNSSGDELGTQTASAIFTEANMGMNGRYTITFGINGSINLRTGDVSITGNARGALTTNDGMAATAAQSTFDGQLSVELVAYELDARYSEENIRKSNLAFKTERRTIQSHVPAGRVFNVEVSNFQPRPEKVLNSLNLITDLGNTHKTLDIIESTIERVKRVRDVEKARGSDVRHNKTLRTQYAAGGHCIPTAIIRNLNWASLNLQRESEVATDVQALFIRLLAGLVAGIRSSSLYDNVINPGETVVFSCVIGNRLKNTLTVAPDYHESLRNQVSGAPQNSDNSLVLNDNTRIDFYGNDFAEWDNKMALFPVRINNRRDITSFAQNRDAGSFVGSHDRSGGGAVWRNFVTMSREILFPTNPIGVILNVDEASLRTYYPDLFNT